MKVKDKKILVMTGILASVFALLSGMLNIYHWWQIGWDPTSYQELVPWFGLLSWFCVVISYKIMKIKNIGLWTLAVFWIAYDCIMFLMVYGLI